MKVFGLDGVSTSRAARICAELDHDAWNAQ
jgi:hypothetical protein